MIVPTDHGEQVLSLQKALCILATEAVLSWETDIRNRDTFALPKRILFWAVCFSSRVPHVCQP